jgi:glycosyltransferase involved in cell wall biosynthesis
VIINYLSFDSISEGVGASQVLNLVEAYRYLDHEVNLLTFEKIQPPPHLINRIESAGIVWTPIKFGRGGTTGGLVRLQKLIRNIPHGDVIHARGDLPAFSGLVGASIPLLWDVRSLWIEQRKIMNPIQFNTTIEVTLRRMNQYVSRNCKAFTTLTDAIVPELNYRYQNLPTFHKTIPTCVDLLNFQVSKSPLNRSLKILLLGNFNNLYNTVWMQRFLFELQDLVPADVLWAHDSSIGYPDSPLNSFQQTSVAHHEVPDLITNSDFGLLLLNNSDDLSLKAAMPTKIAEFWASGRPIIISGGVGDVDSLIHEYGVGLSISESMSTLEILESIRLLIADPDTSERCRFVAEKYFDIRKAAKDYIDLFQQISS